MAATTPQQIEQAAAALSECIEALEDKAKLNSGEYRALYDNSMVLYDGARKSAKRQRVWREQLQARLPENESEDAVLLSDPQNESEDAFLMSMDPDDLEDEVGEDDFDDADEESGSDTDVENAEEEEGRMRNALGEAEARVLDVSAQQACRILGLDRMVKNCVSQALTETAFAFASNATAEDKLAHMRWRSIVALENTVRTLKQSMLGGPTENGVLRLNR